jgi:hypothetical protein
MIIPWIENVDDVIAKDIGPIQQFGLVLCILLDVLRHTQGYLSMAEFPYTYFHVRLKKQLLS